MPNLKQRQKMVRVIESEPFLIHGNLVAEPDTLVPQCQGLGHCAIGALLFAAGISNKRLERVDGDIESLTPAMRQVLKTNYGLNMDDAEFIMEVNDDARSKHYEIEGLGWFDEPSSEIMLNARRDFVINAIYAL
jgi:hypothetical protein